MTAELVAFLERCIAEDEAKAEALPWRTWTAGYKRLGGIGGRGAYVLDMEPRSGDGLELFPPLVDFMARHDPARVLRECEAKRKIIVLHVPPPGAIFPGECLVCVVSWGSEITEDVPCPTLRAVLSVYAGRPGWRDEWATP